ncbi:MAG: MFS transporter [Bacteroidota bacterium]|nr:MFS transporter [Bacteroidota bacterium]
MSGSYLSNIPRLYLIKISKWFMLFMPIIVLFYQENGLGMADAILLKGIYSIVIVIFEIPSGYFADVWGRKKTIIIGSILGTMGFIMYDFSSAFSGFLIAELMLGIGQSFISGSDSALLYDSLLKENRQKDYIKMEGRMLSLGNFAETLAAIAGGFLAEISLRTPFTFQIFVAALAIPAALTLTEPSFENKRKGSFSDILQIVRASLFTNKILKRTIYFSAIIGTSTLTFAWFIQPFLQQLGLSPSRIGFIWSALNLTVALVTLYAYRIEKLLGKTNTIVAIAILISIGYVAIGTIESLWAIAFLFMFYIVRGVATPVLKDYINRLTTSDVRATVLSVRSFIIRFLFAVIGPFLGWYADKFSLQDALWLAGIVFFILSGYTIILWIIAEKK